MGKCKREIFTVIEFVPNWFEAHTSTVTETGKGEGVVNHPRSELGDTSPTKVYTQLAGGGANELNQFPPSHVATITGTGSVPVVGHTRVVTDRLGVNPLVLDRADVGRERVVAQATTCTGGYPDGELPQGMGGVHVEENPTSAAFCCGMQAITPGN